MKRLFRILFPTALFRYTPPPCAAVRGHVIHWSSRRRQGALNQTSISILTARTYCLQSVTPRLHLLRGVFNEGAAEQVALAGVPVYSARARSILCENAEANGALARALQTSHNAYISAHDGNLLIAAQHAALCIFGSLDVVSTSAGQHGFFIIIELHVMHRVLLQTTQISGIITWKRAPPSVVALLLVNVEFWTLAVTLFCRMAPPFCEALFPANAHLETIPGTLQRGHAHT